MADLDPITIDITRYKIAGIAYEMHSILLRSSFSLPALPDHADGLSRHRC